MRAELGEPMSQNREGPRGGQEQIAGLSQHLPLRERPSPSGMGVGRGCAGVLPTRGAWLSPLLLPY